MRKAQKQQAEDFIKILGEAHDEIRKAIEKKNISAALSLLADCQDGAIALGNLIEAAEGKGFGTIALLESYCEQVYRIYGELEKGQPIAVGKAYKNLRQMLFKIESSVKNDIRIRTEVVFLPYKASMWDSLESIWKAADEDPDCDAYVIPIPYYDKNPDGSFRELHYEGGEYPKDVPVVWYEDYDFETRRPDMVFIHNPYDECNIVTSVHPFFYSKNLKKFTDKLVYVPYFILGEVDPEDRQALKDIEKFCLVPGVAYADQVIVQSEDMRQAYVNVLTEFMSGQGRSRAYWEKKILGLGSPKVDKVLGTRKENLEIPEEWKKVIQRPDGSWKKVIFYNTTVTALLQHSEQYLVKLRDVLRVFYENQDEVALLWRPHPLMEATIESMRPELGAAYKEIVGAYRRDGWGVYDDSSDMDRAVCLSDGYYGDGSSVVQLFCALNKFVLHQYIEDEMESMNNLMRVIPRAICGRQCDKYVLDFADNYLYKDCGDGELEFVSDIERGRGCNGFEYGEIINRKNDIIIVPNYCEFFLIYNLVEKSIRHIYVDKKLYENNINKPGFHKIIPYGNKIFITKYVCNAVACIDMNTLEITYTNIFDDSEQEWNLFRTVGDCYGYGSLLYIPLMDTNYFIIFDMENCTHEVKQLYENIKIATICGCGDEVYIVEMNGRKLYTLNLSKWKIQDVMDIFLPDGFIQKVSSEEHDIKFIGSIYYKRQLWLMPYARSNMIVRIELGLRCTECGCQHDMSQVLNYTREGGVLWIYTDKGAIKIDMDTLEVVFTDYFQSKSSAKTYWRHKLHYTGTAIEMNELWFPLENYIEYIAGHEQVKDMG